MVVNDDAGTIYVGCDVGGVYRSSDHGRSWTILNRGLQDYYVQDIAFDPSNPRTVFVATRGGIYKSIDRGDHWRILKNGFPPPEDFSYSAPISDIAVDPVHPSILYAGVGVPRAGYELDGYHWQTAGMKGTIFKSSSSGEFWTPIRNTGIDPEAMIYSLAVLPSDPDVLYAATSFGVYLSTDAGENWMPRSTGLPHGRSMALALHPDDPDILFVTLWAEPGSSVWEGGVYRSDNGGLSWHAVNNGLPQVVGPEAGFTSNFPVIEIDPADPRILYTGNSPWTPDPGIYRSTDGGEHWSWISRDEEPGQNMDLGWITEHGPFVTCLALDPRAPERLYFGTSTHIFKTENSGETWEQAFSDSAGNGYWRGRGLETTCVQTVAVDPTDSRKIYVGYWDMGLMKSTDGGSSFRRCTEGIHYDANTFSIIIDPARPETVWAGTGWWEENQGEICRSDDFGDHWRVIGQGLPDAQIWSMALDESSPPESRTLYAASYEHGIYKSLDGGENWFACNTGLGVEGNLRVIRVVIDPSDPMVLYAGIEAMDIEDGDETETIQGGLFRSDDGGGRWRRIATENPRLIEVRDIVVDPMDHSTIHVAVSSHWDHSEREDYPGGVYTSLDGGTTWSRNSEGLGKPDNLEVVDIVISPSNHRKLYAATADAPYHDRSSGRGIFESSNGGTCWHPVNGDLGILDLAAVTIDPQDPNRIYVGSSGNGLWVGTENTSPDPAWTCRKDRPGVSADE